MTYTPAVKSSFTAPIVARIAAQMGASVHVLPDWDGIGQIRFRSGKCTYFCESTFDLNPQGASRIARDKDAAAHFMSRLGYPVPNSIKLLSSVAARRIGQPFDLDAMYEQCHGLGRPFILKPNSSGQGHDVQVVSGREEFLQAATAIFRRDTVMLGQQIARGNDYRLVVLDGEVVCAYERLPASVTGDGAATVRVLIERKNDALRLKQTGVEIPLHSQRLLNKLRRQGLALGSVPAAGEQVGLLDNANLSAGGDIIDVSERVHPDFERIAVGVTRDMGLRFCGVDLIVDGEIDEAPDKYLVLEINASPGLRQYASFGPVQLERAERFYRKLLEALERM